MAQVARPIADVLVQGTWSPASNVWASLDSDTVEEFATATGAAVPPAEAVNVSLTTTLTPPQNSLATLQFVTRATGNILTKRSLFWSLWQGAELSSFTDSAISFAASWTTTTVGGISISSLSWSDLSIRFLVFPHDTGTMDIGAVTLTADGVPPGIPTLVSPHPQQTYGGTGVPIRWSYSTSTGGGSLTTPYTDISLSTDCGTSWATLADGVVWTPTIESVGYPWNSVASALTVTDCARIRIRARDGDGNASSFGTASGALFPPLVWNPQPYSAVTETWSQTTSPSFETWSLDSCMSSSWYNIGI